MRAGIMTVLLSAAVALLGGVAAVQAQTCEDQYKACVKRGHVASECRTSTDKCLKSGRWIGPAGGEYPVSKKK
jgi:hypothetical protein